MGVDICCIGHITIDRVVTPKNEVYMPGGTSFYFSSAMAGMEVSYELITALAEADMAAVDKLRGKGLHVNVLPSAKTVFFENTYSHNQDHRVQRVLQKADPFTPDRLANAQAQIFHLGPLLADDLSKEAIFLLAKRGKVSLDVQGFLRTVQTKNVCAVDWNDKKEVLPHIHFLKANEDEMHVLTGEKEVEKGAKLLAEWGVKEVIITLGSKGSVIYSKGTFYTIPAFVPNRVEDATGCGDTYMAGYLYKRLQEASCQEAGEFAAAMATLKINHSGPFEGTSDDVAELLAKKKQEAFSA